MFTARFVQAFEGSHRVIWLWNFGVLFSLGLSAATAIMAVIIWYESRPQ